MTTRTAGALIGKAKAHPTKAFFVRMLTRDITAADCILDLIDNSVDAAWARSGAAPRTLEAGRKLSKFAVHLTISQDKFVIADNCGGISLQDAAEYAFTFGREALEGRTDYSVGVYGIGMKRAIFKLGTQVTVRSSHKGEQPFEVPIDVNKWLQDTSEAWDFDIEPAEPLPAPGLELSVQVLTPESSSQFSDPGFINAVRASIARDYMLPLMQGLTITLNGASINGWTADLMEGAEFAPMRASYQDGEVSVEILAGMFKPPPDSNEPSRSKDERSGWYVLCNGRVVVAADRTPLTVWGRPGFPGWHGQYEGFFGVILFSSRRPELLPMTTTKSGIDASSSLYRRSQAHMEPPTRAWVSYTNARKTRREAARERERAATPVPITKVKRRDELGVPSDIGEASREANILYTKPVADVRALAKAFGRSTMSYKEVGSRSFDYSYARLVSES